MIRPHTGPKAARAPPAQARRELLLTIRDAWKEPILADLERDHRDIRNCVARIDFFRNAHAMVRHAPLFLTNPERKSWQNGRERSCHASAGVSGFSIFEEAQYCGAEAARWVLTVFRRTGR